MEFSKAGKATIRAFGQHPRYVSNCGGTRSGKTYGIIQMLIYIHYREACEDRPAQLTSIVSETYPHLRRGCIRDFKEIMSREGIWEEDRWSKTESTYEFHNGGKMEFFSADSPGKVHGAARDRLFINECQNISWEVARQLFVRTKGQIVMDYNPTHAFWLNEKIECREECIVLHSTYRDNDYLSQEQIAEIESNKDDGNWWKVYGEGKVGTLEGVIYSFEMVDRMPPRVDKPSGEKTDEELYADSLIEIWGIDFGFTNDPTAMVRILADPKRKVAYVQQKCYRTRMLNADIAKRLTDEHVAHRTEVYADCAEPKSIAEISREGFNIIACDKDAPVRSDKLTFQLQWMQGWALKVTKDSVDLINEIRNYTWAKDKDGKLLNQPIDKFNHLMDAMRYALFTKFGKRGGYGKYSVSVHSLSYKNRHR